ncbi:hypothetical protein F8271_24980 [Micromonospora sp. ALFpr18c]|nr:hypothetical protein F8271_24980 [Micromonospora sp. ALFpr18c]
MSRRFDGQPETEADRKFFDLRESGYTGPIDQDGNADSGGRQTSWTAQPQPGGTTWAAARTPASTTATSTARSSWSAPSAAPCGRSD